MKTKDFLIEINKKIEEAFKPILNKPVIFGFSHSTVADAVMKAVTEYGVEYHTWYLRPPTVSGVLYPHDVELFKLNTSGFKKYKNRAAHQVKGKWITPPFYEIYEDYAEVETIEEVVQLGMIKHINKRIASQQKHIEELVVNHKNALDYLSELYRLRTPYFNPPKTKS